MYSCIIVFLISHRNCLNRSELSLLAGGGGGKGPPISTQPHQQQQPPSNSIRQSMIAVIDAVLIDSNMPRMNGPGILTKPYTTPHHTTSQHRNTILHPPSPSHRVCFTTYPQPLIDNRRHCGDAKNAVSRSHHRGKWG